MAAPVLESITVDPEVIPPGGTATITVVASDGDNRTATVTITGTDSTGATVTGEATIRISDPVTVVATVDGVELPVDGQGRFVYTAA